MGVKRPGHGINQAPPSMCQRVKERVKHLLPVCVFVAGYRVIFTFIFNRQNKRHVLYLITLFALLFVCV